MPHGPCFTLALDPSLAETGYAILELRSGEIHDTGTIPTRSTDSDRTRLWAIGCALTDLIARFRPRDLAIELPFVGRNRATALTLGAVRGVILYTAAQHDLPVHEYTTSQVKSAVTGVPTASKTQVQAMIARLTGRRLTNHNESDAVAVGLTHVKCRRFHAAINNNAGT